MEASTEKKTSLYQKHIPIYTRSVKGKFRNFKTIILVLALTIYFILPWLPWERHSAASQAVLFDLVTRRFFVFDLVVYPQDIFWLAMLLFIAAAFLFFITGLVGRAWCGYFCFQTLWSDLFMWVEYWIQGERAARIRLRKQPWNAEKILKIGGSHGLIFLISFWTGFTFIAYFAYAPELLVRFFTGQAVDVAYFTAFLLTLSTYIAGGLAREQVCIYMCPYARFQGVMYEPDTLAVSYDTRRGEATAGRIGVHEGLRTRQQRQEKGHGDCIDCGFCVQVCPTGIDIRNGLQYQCISCGLCIDACNNIMDSIGFPRGLIRYASERDLQSEHADHPHLKWKRLKVVGYASALLIMLGALGWNIASHSDIEVGIQQVRKPLYVMMSDDTVRNRYQIHIVNKSEQDQNYSVTVRGIPQSALDLGALTEIKVRAGKSLKIFANVDIDERLAENTHQFEFLINPTNNTEGIVRKVDFSSPAHKHKHEAEHDQADQ